MYTPQNSDFFNAFAKRLQLACSQILCASGSGYKCCYNWNFNTSPFVEEVCFPIETELKSRKQGEGATRRQATKFPPFIGGGLRRGLSCKGKVFASFWAELGLWWILDYPSPAFQAPSPTRGEGMSWKGGVKND